MEKITITELLESMGAALQSTNAESMTIRAEGADIVVSVSVYRKEGGAQ